MDQTNNIEWFHLGQALSYQNGIYYFYDTVRNIGKSWGLQKYAWRRAYKHGKKCIFVRKYKKEANRAAESLYTSKDVIEFCTGLIPYNEATKKGNMKRRGKTFYIKRNKKWVWFLKIVHVSEFKDVRGTDDIDCDRILYDEYTTTLPRQKLYRGNEVEDFADMTVSIARQHDIKVLFCGNKEAVLNPFYSYFHIKPLPVDFQGIRTFHNGTIVVQQYNETKYINKALENRLKALFKGTPYGRYMFEAKYKNEGSIRYREPPATASGYAQFIWNDVQLSVLSDSGLFYCKIGIDTTTYCEVDKIYNGLVWQKQLNKRTDRDKYRSWQQAYLTNRVYYKNRVAYEITQQIMKWFGIVNTN